MARVAIRYCPRCKWLPRAAWLAQELLGTFTEELSEVALVPDARGGVLEVLVDGEVVASRKRDGGLLQPKELKQRVRDKIAPNRDLGHVDRSGAK